jgi:hypothetical protein
MMYSRDTALYTYPDCTTATATPLTVAGSPFSIPETGSVPVTLAATSADFVDNPNAADCI